MWGYVDALVHVGLREDMCEDVQVRGKNTCASRYFSHACLRGMSSTQGIIMKEVLVSDTNVHSLLRRTSRSLAST